MPAIITIAHQKGGCGKSTLANNLAHFYALNDVNCALVDTDVQGSISDAFTSFEDRGMKSPVNLIRRQDFKNFDELLALNQYDLLVIDTPPIMTTDLKDLYRISNFVLIPMKPAVNDFYALNRTVKFVEDYIAENQDVKTGIVLNMTVNSSDIQKQIREGLKETPIRILKSEVAQRVEFMRCLLYATSIFDTSDKKAKEEIETLGNEIYAILQE